MIDIIPNLPEIFLKCKTVLSFLLNQLHFDLVIYISSTQKFLSVFVLPRKTSNHCYQNKDTLLTGRTAKAVLFCALANKLATKVICDPIRSIYATMFVKVLWTFCDTRLNVLPLMLLAVGKTWLAYIALVDSLNFEMCACFFR